MPSIFNNEQNCSYPVEPIAECYVFCDEDNNVLYQPAPSASVIYEDFTAKSLIKRGIDPSRIVFSDNARCRLDCSDALFSFTQNLVSSDKPE